MKTAPLSLVKSLSSLFVRAAPGDSWLAIGFTPGEVCIACVRRVSGGGRPEVLICRVEPLTMPDPAGLEKLAKEIQMSGYRCLMLLNLNEYQMLLVEAAPNVRPDELKTAVRWRIKDLLDYHIDDAAIDVLSIPLVKDAPVGNQSMYAVAARNEIIQRYVTVMEQARIPLSVIDLPEMAQRNVASLLENEGEGLALLSFGEEGGLLTVTYSGELYLSRHIEAPLSQLMQADSEQQQRYFDRVVVELQRSLDYFDRQYHFIPLTKLMLAPLPLPTGLEAYLADNLHLPVQPIDLNQVFDFSRIPGLQSDQQAQCFLALGASLRLEEKAF